MKTLRQTITEFHSSHRALGHFNFSDSNQLKAIALASKETGLPVLVALSEGEREFFPLSHARLLVDAYCAQGVEMYLSADHTYSIEKVQRALVAGVDAVVVDGAKLPLQENIGLLRTAVKYARVSGREILMEGELGYIGQSSEVIEKIPEGAVVSEEMMTNPEELKKFVEETGVDMMAPAVGNIHGIITSGQPKLSISRIVELAHTSSVPLVLHGGSGSPDEEFSAAVKAGIAIIHINTELRLTYRHGIERALREMPNEAAPYKFLMPAVEDMQKYVAQKMRLFAGQ